MSTVKVWFYNMIPEYHIPHNFTYSDYCVK